ncbi:transporter substrate-binding domain-containing protein [Aminipila butyrica]|uniref:Transporter substrate-binding domain-containing protein n=1 Tax=Aminipila butyrica TaxID=433296 RepID=A0A858BUV2_9FIRM|nr:transporter substrate-binding domain-containing protein [Aminipila butyrica]QIB68868.1 transporter substrate-binding domain-containing protein [Aminipila butyrica]
MKRNWKRLLIFSAVLCLMLSLAACGPKEDGADQATDNQRKVLRVGMECAYAPFNWTQPDDTNGAVPIVGTKDYANGYDILYASKVAEAMGYELEVYRIEWDGLIPALQTDKIDAVIAGMCMTDARRESVDFSDIYYQADMVPLTMKSSKYAEASSLEDLAGATATSQLNTVWYDILDQIPKANLTPGIDTVPGVIVSLTSGKSEIVTVDMPTALAAVAANPDIKILNLDKGNFVVDKGNVDMGIAVKKGNRQLLEAINGVVKTISSEDREAMMEEAIEIQPLS